MCHWWLVFYWYAFIHLSIWLFSFPFTTKERKQPYFLTTEITFYLFYFKCLFFLDLFSQWLNNLILWNGWIERCYYRNIITYSNSSIVTGSSSLEKKGSQTWHELHIVGQALRLVWLRSTDKYCENRRRSSVFTMFASFLPNVLEFDIKINWFSCLFNCNLRCVYSMLECCTINLLVPRA